MYFETEEKIMSKATLVSALSLHLTNQNKPKLESGKMSRSLRGKTRVSQVTSAENRDMIQSSLKDKLLAKKVPKVLKILVCFISGQINPGDHSRS